VDLFLEGGLVLFPGFDAVPLLFMWGGFGVGWLLGEIQGYLLEEQRAKLRVHNPRAHNRNCLVGDG